MPSELGDIYSKLQSFIKYRDALPPCVKSFLEVEDKNTCAMKHTWSLAALACRLGQVSCKYVDVAGNRGSSKLRMHGAAVLWGMSLIVRLYHR